MMWKRPVSKFKNVEADDCNRHPSLRLGHTADKVTTLSVSEEWLVWSLNDGSVLAAANLPDLSGAPKRLSGAPSALNASLGPFRGASARLACLSANSLFVCAADRTLQELDSGHSLALPFTVRRQGALAWNRSAEAVLAVCSGESGLLVADAAAPAVIWSSDLPAATNDADWDPFGGQLAVILNDGHLFRCDPRAKTADQVLETKFSSGSESRVVWTSDSNHVLVSGSDSMREREVRLYDLRAPTAPVGRMACGRGLSPAELLYDGDTGMLHCFAKMDPTVYFAEVLAEGAEPLCCRSKAMLGGPISAAVAAPRWANDLMQCEVVRLFVACGERVSQCRYRVPRKSYTEFFPAAFELAFLGEPAVSNAEWLDGASFLPKRAHLTPGLQAKMLGGEEGGNDDRPSPEPQVTPAAAPRAATPPPVAERAASSRRVLHIERGSAFKHLEGRLSQRCEHVPLSRQLESRVPTECDLLAASARFIAFQVVGAAALELHDRRNLQQVTTLESGSPLQHFAFDQLHPSRLAVGCTDGRVRVWSVTEEEGDLLRDPELILGGHNAKISLVLFHRAVADLLLTAAFDGEVHFWDLAAPDAPLGSLRAPGPLLALCWSPDGNRLAGLDDSGRVRVWPDPRAAPDHVIVSPEPVSTPRGGRLVWCRGDVLLASGFQGNKRLLTVLTVKENALRESDCLAIETTSPAVLALIPDVDKCLVLAVGRGDHTVRGFDVASGALSEVSSFASDVQLQGLTVFSPYECDVTLQEVFRGMLLTPSSLQPITFAVPRVKTEYFHDDLFPACSTPPGPVTSAAQWWSGEADGGGAEVSLQPAGMPLYSDWRREEDERQRVQQTKFTARTEAARTELTEKQRQEKLVESMKNILNSNALPAYTPDEGEGVDSDEWDD